MRPKVWAADRDRLAVHRFRCRSSLAAPSPFPSSPRALSDGKPLHFQDLAVNLRVGVHGADEDTELYAGGASPDPGASG